MKEMKETYMKNYIKAVRTDTMKSLSTYQKLVQEREEEMKRDREIMFETGFPCLVLGLVAGMIIAGMLVKIS